MPAVPAASNTSKKQEIEDEVFGEVSGFPDEVVKGVELILCERRYEPMEEGPKDGTGVSGGKRVGGRQKYYDAPSQRGHQARSHAGIIAFAGMRARISSEDGEGRGLRQGSEPDKYRSFSERTALYS